VKKLNYLWLVIFIGLLTISCSNESQGNKSKQEEQTIELNQSFGPLEEEGGLSKGYMWSVSKGTSKVYLFGSIHMATSSLYPFNAEVEGAFRSSDYLVLEADPTDLSGMVELSTKMMYKGDETVYDHLSPQGIEKYKDLMEDLNYPPFMFEKIKIWALGSSLMALQLDQAGYTPDSGVDYYFAMEAMARSIPLIELEGALFQVDLMSSFSDQIQEYMFIDSLGSSQETIEEFEHLYELYRAGDKDAMTDYLMTETQSPYPEADRAMLDDRNLEMAKKIEGYLDTEDQYFVVVGLAHLLGNKSIVKILESKGYEVHYFD